jgi:hypothetical protein
MYVLNSPIAARTVDRLIRTFVPLRQPQTFQITVSRKEASLGLNASFLASRILVVAAVAGEKRNVSAAQPSGRRSDEGENPDTVVEDDGGVWDDCARRVLWDAPT